MTDSKEVSFTSTVDDGNKPVIYRTGWVVTPDEKVSLEDLDDPYLELFDRINQMELDIKELRALVMQLNPLVSYLKRSKLHLTADITPEMAKGFKFFE